MQADKFFENKQQPDNINSLIVVAWELQTPENIGSIIRLCGNFNVKKVYFINDYPFKESKIKNVASTAFKKVNWQYSTAEDFLSKYKNNYHFVAVETAEGAESITKAKLPKNVVFIVGNERSGLSDEILSLCDQKVYIPMTGSVNSMNVSHALAILLFKYDSLHNTDGK